MIRKLRIQKILIAVLLSCVCLISKAQPPSAGYTASTLTAIDSFQLRGIWYKYFYDSAGVINIINNSGIIKTWYLEDPLYRQVDTVKFRKSWIDSLIAAGGGGGGSSIDSLRKDPADTNYIQGLKASNWTRQLFIIPPPVNNYVNNQVLFGASAGGGISQDDGFRYDSTSENLYLGSGNTPSTYAGLELNNGRATLKAALNGLNLDMGAPSNGLGIDDGSKRMKFQNRGNSYLEFYSNVIVPGDAPTYRLGTFINTKVQIGAGTYTPSSALTVNSTAQGVLLPRMNTTEMNAIGSPANGLFIYNTDSASHFQYNGSAWQNLYNVVATPSTPNLEEVTASGRATSRNIKIGGKTFGYGTDSTRNSIAIGDLALTTTGIGSNNIAIGDYSLRRNTSGSLNTAVGSSTLSYNTTTSYNTAIGFGALENSTASVNTAVGATALQTNTTGAINTAVGYRSLFENTTGSNNTGIGYNTLIHTTTENNNTALGSLADVAAGQSGSTAIGANSFVGISYAISYGDSSLNTKHGFGTSYPSKTLDVNGDTRFRGNGVPGSNKVPTGTDGSGNWIWQTPSGSGGLQQAFDNSVTAGDNPTINGHGTDILKIDSTTFIVKQGDSNFLKIRPYDDGGSELRYEENGGAAWNFSYNRINSNPEEGMYLSSSRNIYFNSSGLINSADLKLDADAGQLRVSTNFINRLTILNNGNVGIGTSIPTEKLEVNGNVKINYGGLLISAPEGEKFIDVYEISSGASPLYFEGIANAGAFLIDSLNQGYRVGIGTSNPSYSSALEINSTTRGFLLPRMTATEAEGISSPAEGLMIYSKDGTGANITSKGWWGFNGTTWQKLN